MGHPVLEGSEFSVPITLHHYGGAETVTRGIFTRLPYSKGQFEGAFSESGGNAWVSTPATRTEVEWVDVTNPATDVVTRYRALDEQRVRGPQLGSAPTESTRYQLIETTGPVVTPRDFSEVDFGGDFG